MDKRLCVYWESEGQKGYAGVCDDTPENRLSLAAQAERMQGRDQSGKYTVEPYTQVTPISMPGTLVARMQPSGMK